MRSWKVHTIISPMVMFDILRAKVCCQLKYPVPYTLQGVPGGRYITHEHSVSSSHASGRRSAAFKEAVLARDGDGCIFCDEPWPMCDRVHMIPFSRGDTVSIHSS